MSRNKSTPATLGSRLREARTAAELTQSQLADAVEVGDQHISDLERDKKDCTSRLARRLADALDVSLDWLVPPNGKA